MGKKQQVKLHPKGGWLVKGERNEKATVRTDPQKRLLILDNLFKCQNHFPS